MERLSIQDALAYCLANPDNLSPEELLDRFPEHRQELGDLLALDASIKRGVDVGMAVERRAAVKEHLISAARAAQAGSRVEPATARPLAGRIQFRPWWVGTALVILVALVWWLSARSLPDSPFYGVKLTTENFLLNFAGGPADQARGHLNLANVRLFDLREMQLLSKVNQAGPAVENYDYHLGSCVDIWEALADEDRGALTKLLYSSSVASQQVFAPFSQAAEELPEALGTSIRRTVDEISNLNSETTAALQSAGLDPDQVLAEVGGQIAPLLTPVATPLPAPTPGGSATPTTTQTTVPTAGATFRVQATASAALFVAQTVIADSDSFETPVVYAAETVLAAGTGTPDASALETVVSAGGRLPTETPALTTTVVVPTVTVGLSVTPVATVTVGLPATVAPTIPAVPPITGGSTPRAVPITVAEPTEPELPVNPTIGLPR